MTSMVYTVRWEKNGSKCYDGRTQDVPEEAVLESDRARGVGDSVRVEWGSRLWNAVVLEKQPAPSLLDTALPDKRLRRATQIVSSFVSTALAPSQGDKEEPTDDAAEPPPLLEDDVVCCTAAYYVIYL